MSQPVFGREPSRPLPRDDDEPTQEIDLTDATQAEPEPPEGDESSELDAPESEVAEPDVAEVGDVEDVEEDVDDVEEVEEHEPGEPASVTEGESALLDVGEPDSEPVVLDIEHPEPAEPVPVVAEAVSAEPDRADGDEGAWVEIQAHFVDDPQAATAGALRMLRERLDGLAPAGASTEDLRVAFQRYRAAWHDLAEK